MLARVLEFLMSLQRISLQDLWKAHFSFARFRASADDPRFWIVLAAVIAVALLGYYSYRGQSASPRKRRIMGIVRATVLVLLVLLVCRPQLTVDQPLRMRSVVAVWVDNSASMQLQDPYRDPKMKTMATQVSTQLKLPAKTRPSRWDLALAELSEPNNWLHEQAKGQDIAIFTGGPHAELVGGSVAHNPEQVDEKLKQLKTTQQWQPATDMPVVVQEMFEALQGQPVSAVVVLTDGRSTEGSMPTVATTLAQQHRTPMFALPVGEAQEPLNLAISAPELPASAFVRDPVSVKVKVHAGGLDRSAPARLSLMRKTGAGETQLATKEVTLEPGKDQTVELVFKPEKLGGEKVEAYDLVVRAEPIGEELSLADNHVEARTVVMDAKVNVLYVEGTPRWEFRYLKNELMREKTVNVSTLLLSADEGFAQEGDPAEVDQGTGKETFPGPITRFPETVEELNKYDVILIGDVEPQFFSPAQMKMLVDFVRKTGGGVGWIAGRQYTPDAYRGTALEALLPIVPDDPNAPSMTPPENAPFTLTLTAEGRASNLFQFFPGEPEKSLQQMADNPPLFWYRPVIELKKNAELLAVHPSRTQNGGAPAPLLVTAQYGAGRTLFSAICDTWRWRRYVGEPHYQTYWLQVCRLLYREKAMGQSKRFELVANARLVEVGRQLKITGTVRDATLSDTLPPQFVVQVFDENDRPMEPVTLSRVGGNTETFEGTMTALTEGNLKLSIPTGILPQEVVVPPVEVQVTPPGRELANVTVDMNDLQRLTDALRPITGGRDTAQRDLRDGAVVTMPEANQLATLISERHHEVRRDLPEELWNKPLALLLIVGLLTTEWLLRKSAGLI